MLYQLTPFQEILSRWNKQIAIPLEIHLIDELLGGILPCHLQLVIGDSGAGKTLYCMKVISQLLKRKPEAQILYSDFEGNFRINNLRKMLSDPSKLNQIVIFQPKSLLEQIVLFRNLVETSRYSYDLIILDSVFGSPLSCLAYFQKEQKLWEKRLFSHFLDLQLLARNSKIPILLTNHLISTKKPESSSNQFGEDLIRQFVPIEFFIQKIEQKQFLEVRVFQKLVGSSDFVLIPR